MALSWCLDGYNMSLKTVRTSLRKITKSLSVSQTKREYLIKNTRNVIILSSQAIISIHKGDLKAARSKLKKAKTLLRKNKEKAQGELRRLIITPEQEYMEATALLAISEMKEVPSASTLKVSEEAYVLGLLDCIGELKRTIYDKIRVGNTHEATRIFKIMEELYLQLYPLAVYDKILRESRKKLDVNRILLEETRAAITEEIRRAELIGTLNRLKK